MAGRNAKPVGLHLAQGNPSHLTKAEIDARKDAEVKLGEQDLKKLRKPSFVSKDKAATKLWNELIKEYTAAAKQGVTLLTSSDVGMLALYCKTFSEYERLLVQYQRVEDVVIDEDVLDEFITKAEIDGGEVNYKALRYLSQLASLEGILKVEIAINKKMDMLLKMQDRLFLNPLAKVKNVPKPKEEKTESPMAKFMKRKVGGGHGP